MGKEGKVKVSSMYKPMSDYVLMPYKEVERTKSGIIIPDAETSAKFKKGDREPLQNAIEREQSERNAQFYFEVVAVGPETKMVKEGDFVLMAPAARAAVFELAGTKYVQCREYDLFAVVTKEFIEMDEAVKAAKANRTLSASEIIPTGDGTSTLTVVH